MVSYADQKEGSTSLRAANCETATTFVGSWEVQRNGVKRKPNTMRPRRPWGLRTAKLLPLSWAPVRSAEWRHTQIRMRPRRPWKLRFATRSPLSCVAGGSSEVVSHADQNQASPPLRAANGKTVATCGGVSGGASVVTSVADQNETSPSLRAANSENVATGVGSWGGPAA